MYPLLQKRISRITASNVQALLQHGLIGIEKETLRVGNDGKIAQSPHPHSLGAALTHPFITTDYSEALTEIITPPVRSSVEALEFLRDIQTFIYSQLEDEKLWATSMPCVVAGDTSIPIANYGPSNSGMMKTVYRRGLGHRYGRAMQVIAGVHFNYSIPEEFWPVYQQMEGDSGDLQAFISERYFDLIRNLLRFGWLVPYLFGASPAVCKSFLAGQETDLAEFNENTYYEPYATSLRMGDFGYQNNKEKASGVSANYDSLQTYVESLTEAISTPCPAYEKMGICVDGEYQQLNANILQIENEYYSTVRPKQILNGHEKPTLALLKRGVRYVELRSLDVNAFDPLGINQTQANFLEIFMIFCLLHESKSFSPQEKVEIDDNELITAHRGREPGCMLMANGQERPLKEWALELFDNMRSVTDLLDFAQDDHPYQDSLDILRERVLEPELTPSARMLAVMLEKGEGFFHFAKRMSLQHQEYFRQLTLTNEKRVEFTDWAVRSHEKLKEINELVEPDFGKFLADYFAQS